MSSTLVRVFMGACFGLVIGGVSATACACYRIGDDSHSSTLVLTFQWLPIIILGAAGGGLTGALLTYVLLMKRVHLSSLVVGVVLIGCVTWLNISTNTNHFWGWPFSFQYGGESAVSSVPWELIIINGWFGLAIATAVVIVVEKITSGKTNARHRC